MQETYGSLWQAPATKTHVLPYRYIEERLTQAEWDFEKDVTNAAGSVWSSVHDMSLWAQFLLRGATTADGQKLLTDDAVSAMFEPQQLATPDDFYPTVALTQPNWRTYGLAWFQQDFQGHKIDFHTGSLSGLIAIIGLDRAENRAVVVLGNRDHAEMRHALLWSVMDNSATNDRRDWNQEIFDLYQASADEEKAEREQQDEARIKRTKPGLPLAAYAGTYSNVIVGELMVVRERKALSLISGRYAFRLDHWHHEVFAITKPEWDFRDFVTFEIGPDGTITKMVVFGENFEPVAVE
jgi:CubicO group peptidase (beta-lactamase class C family)